MKKFIRYFLISSFLFASHSYAQVSALKLQAQLISSANDLQKQIEAFGPESTNGLKPNETKMLATARTSLADFLENKDSIDLNTTEGVEKLRSEVRKWRAGFKQYNFKSDAELKLFYEKIDSAMNVANEADNNIQILDFKKMTLADIAKQQIEDKNTLEVALSKMKDACANMLGTRKITPNFSEQRDAILDNARKLKEAFKQFQDRADAKVTTQERAEYDAAVDDLNQSILEIKSMNFSQYDEYLALRKRIESWQKAYKQLDFFTSKSDEITSGPYKGTSMGNIVTQLKDNLAHAGTYHRDNNRSLHDIITASVRPASIPLIESKLKESCNESAFQKPSTSAQKKTIQLEGPSGPTTNTH